MTDFGRLGPRERASPSGSPGTDDRNYPECRVHVAGVRVAAARSRIANRIRFSADTFGEERGRDLEPSLSIDRPPTQGLRSSALCIRSSRRPQLLVEFFSDDSAAFPAIGNRTPHSWEIPFHSSRCFDTPHDREYTFRENTNKQSDETQKRERLAATWLLVTSWRSHTLA
jgi:hypothetical protein